MKKILLIEDNGEMRENIIEILELSGYLVIGAENGRKGIEKAIREKPDLIICDIMMPELDGYGVLHILTKSPQTAAIPFMFLTAKSEKSDIRKGMNLGADDYLTKPFDDTELLEAISVRLKRSEIMKSDYGNDMKGLSQFLNSARSLKDLQDLSDQQKVGFFKKKEVLFSEGDPSNYLYLITKGKIRCSKMDIHGKELVTNLYLPSDFLGYMALLEGVNYQETAVALEYSEVVIIEKKDFLILINENRDVANKFIQMLANNILDQQEKLLDLAYSPVRERTAKALIKLYMREGDANINISREDLANYIGTAKETLIRTLSEFKSEGLIEAKNHNIVISNVEALLEVGNPMAKSKARRAS